MKWIPIFGLIWITKDEPDDIIYVYQLACIFVFWPIILLFVLKLLNAE